MTPGPKPVTADPGLTPMSPVTIVCPIFVTVEPARTPKVDADPRETGDCLALLDDVIDEEDDSDALTDDELEDALLESDREVLHDELRDDDSEDEMLLEREEEKAF